MVFSVSIICSSLQYYLEESINIFYKYFGSVSTSFCVWLNIYKQLVYRTDKIIVIGEEPLEVVREVRTLYKPHKFLKICTAGNKEFLLIANWFVQGKILIYLYLTYTYRVHKINVAQIMIYTYNKTH